LGLLYCLVKGPTEAFVYPSSCDAVSRPSLPMHRLRLLGEKLVIRIEAERNFSLLACPGLHLSGLLRRKEFLLPARSRSRGAGVGGRSARRPGASPGSWACRTGNEYPIETTLDDSSTRCGWLQA